MKASYSICIHTLYVSLVHFNYFVVTKAATERCFLNMAAPNKLIKSLRNTCEWFVFWQNYKMLACGFAKNGLLVV